MAKIPYGIASVSGVCFSSSTKVTRLKLLPQNWMQRVDSCRHRLRSRTDESPTGKRHTPLRIPSNSRAGQRLPVGLLSLSANSKPWQALEQAPSRRSAAHEATLQRRADHVHFAITWLAQQQVKRPSVTSRCDRKARSDGAR